MQRLVEHEAELPLRPDGGLVLGVVADTHSQLHPQALDRLAALAPDAILHGGDIGAVGQHVLHGDRSRGCRARVQPGPQGAPEGAGHHCLVSVVVVHRTDGSVGTAPMPRHRVAAGPLPG